MSGMTGGLQAAISPIEWAQRPNASRSVLVPAWRRIARAARGPHHRSPPVSTYRNGTSGMRLNRAHASFAPPPISRRVAKSTQMRITATGWRRQTRSSRTFFITRIYREYWGCRSGPYPRAGMNRVPDRLCWVVVVVLCVRVTCTLAENDVAGAPLGDLGKMASRTDPGTAPRGLVSSPC